MTATTPHPFIPNAVCELVYVTGDGGSDITDVWVAPESDRDGLSLGLVGEFQRDDGVDKPGERIWNPVYAGDTSPVLVPRWWAPIREAGA